MLFRSPQTEVPDLGPADETPLAGLAEAGRRAIALSGVRKRFGSLGVLEGIEFSARRGELLSLVGPNGAGKTTLMRCISDGAERSGGSVLVNDHDIGRRAPHACVAFGVGRKFQNANTFDALTVAQSLRIARTRLALLLRKGCGLYIAFGFVSARVVPRLVLPRL